MPADFLENKPEIKRGKKDAAAILGRKMSDLAERLLETGSDSKAGRDTTILVNGHEVRAIFTLELLRDQ